MRRDRGWRAAGVLIVAAAAALAALLVVVLRPAGRHSPQMQARVGGGDRGASRIRAGADQRFSYCATRNAKFRDPGAFVGITDRYLTYDPSTRGCGLGLVAARHIGYFRAQINWAAVEPARGAYDFAFYDQLVAQLARHHLRLLPVLMATPRWASTGPAGGKRFGAYPPANSADLAEFAAACVQRYGPGGSFWRANPKLPHYPVEAWQIWNEPNLVGSWRPRTDPAGYVRVLRASYAAIKRVDPHATVVTAGMPFFTAAKERSFITELFRAGMAGNFDALAIHSYSPLQAPQRLALARRLMNQFGATHAQLWATELAWAGGPPDPWAVNPSTQASAIRSFFRWAAHNRARLGLGKVFWFSLRDHVYGADPSWWGYHLGLLTTNRRPKPALGALSAAAQRLDG